MLLLDEPLGALNLKMRRHIQVELKNLQDRVGVTFIYVTHDQESAPVTSCTRTHEPSSARHSTGSYGSALSCIVVVTVAAYGLVRFKFRGKRLLQTLIVLPIIVPHLVFGIDLLLFFKAIGISPNAFTVCIAHIVLAFPFAVMLISTSLSGFNPTLEDAAQDLGANERRTFFRVTLPLIAPGVVSAILVSFTVSFDEFAVSFFVSGKGVVTLPLFLYSELRFSVTPEINAISTFVLVISVLVIGLMQWLQGRVSQRS